VSAPRLATVPSILLAALGCTTVRSVEAGSVPVLGRNEGLLVVHVESALPIRKLSIDQVPALTDLREGEHFSLLVVSAGRHHWSEIVVPAAEGDVRFRMSDEHWGFRVESGRINYPDQLVVRGDVGKAHVEIGGGRRNRSALALRKLQERFPELLARYPPVYGGFTPDRYLEYYVRPF
jgi:hypothetical protein